ncbi:MAG TPA: VOC family protein [Rhizomicrobium sp.]|nr:VOC family protein [Rhizomicrobium sp.]
MQARLAYVMKFVTDMERAVRFHRDTLGLPLKFQSPGWSEFSTGDVTLALHPAREGKPAGSIELGFQIRGLEALHARGEASGLTFSGPLRREHGVLLAPFLDSEGALCTASE